MTSEFNIGGIGYLLVEAQSRYEDSTGAKGIGGKDIVVDTRWEPLKYVKTFGKVVQIPYAMGQRPIDQIPVGMPSYGPRRGDVENAPSALYSTGSQYRYIRLSDVAQEVKIGDTLWFNRTVLNDTNNIVDEFDRDGVKTYVFKVDYDLAICVEKKEPIMLGGWCFLEPIMENWDKQFIPTKSSLKDANGNPILKPRDQWLQIALQPEQEKLRARLKYFGTPLRGDKFYYSKDSEVFIRRQVRWRYPYKGVEYMLVKQGDIFCEVKD
jgi:hypothetical protein